MGGNSSAVLWGTNLLNKDFRGWGSTSWGVFSGSHTFIAHTPVCHFFKDGRYDLSQVDFELLMKLKVTLSFES